MIKKKSSSISTRVSCIFLAMLIISAAAIGGFSFVLYRQNVIAENAERALAIAQSVAAVVDGDQMQEIIEGGERTEYISGLELVLDGVLERTGATYLYVMRSQYDSNTYYFADGDTDGTGMYFGDADSVENFSEQMFEAIDLGIPQKTEIYDSGDYGMMLSGFSPLKNSAGKVVGVVGCDITIDEVLRNTNLFGVRIIIIALSFGIVFGAICFLFIRRMIGLPIRSLTSASRQIAKGDMDLRIDIASRDEVGQLAESFNEMIDSTKKQITLLERLADGDLTMEAIPRDSKDAMGIALEKTTESLNDIVIEIYKSTAQVSAGANRISAGAQSLAQGTSAQSSAMETLLHSISDITGKIEHNMQMADKAATLVNEIRKNAEDGSQQMGGMVAAVGEIDEANQSIGRVIKIIEDIAFQTNILALNAAVEAARAGQHGKGFAVVADEVRSLASKSAASAKDTAELIENSTEKIQQGVKIVGETAASLNKIIEGVEESSGIVGRIAKASEDQNSDIIAINDNMGQVAQVVQQNSTTAQESAAASREMSNQAATLETLLSRFRLKS